MIDIHKCTAAITVVLTNEQLDSFRGEYDFLVKKYREQYARHTIRNWSAYERSYEQRIKCAARELYSVVKSASSIILPADGGMGRPSKVTSEQKVVILLLKAIFQLSNRKIAGLLSLFGPLTDIDISYKTVERAYSSLPVEFIIHNMLVLLASTMNEGLFTSDRYSRRPSADVSAYPCLTISLSRSTTI